MKQFIREWLFIDGVRDRVIRLEEENRALKDRLNSFEGMLEEGAEIPEKFGNLKYILQVVRQLLNKLGYQISWEMVPDERYNVSQIRMRRELILTPIKNPKKKI